MLGLRGYGHAAHRITESDFDFDFDFASYLIHDGVRDLVSDI